MIPADSEMLLFLVVLALVLIVLALVLIVLALQLVVLDTDIDVILVRTVTLTAPDKIRDENPS